MRTTRTLVALVLAVTACQGATGPVRVTAVGQDAPASHVASKTVASDVGAFDVYGGTLTSTGQIYTAAAAAYACGADSIAFMPQPSGDSLSIQFFNVCHDVASVPQVQLDGGEIDVSGSANGVTAPLGVIQGEFDIGNEYFDDVALNVTVTLSAHPFSGYEFLRWDTYTISGQRTSTTSSVIVRPANSNGVEYRAWFKQLPSSPTGGSGGGSGGGGGCLQFCS